MLEKPSGDYILVLRRSLKGVPMEVSKAVDPGAVPLVNSVSIFLRLKSFSCMANFYSLRCELGMFSRSLSFMLYCFSYSMSFCFGIWSLPIPDVNITRGWISEPKVLLKELMRAPGYSFSIVARFPTRFTLIPALNVGSAVVRPPRAMIGFTCYTNCKFYPGRVT